MLAKDGAKTAALRNVKAAVRNREIDEKKALDDQGMIAVLSTLKKKIEDSIAQFKTGGREDLVAKESAELAIIQAYLPQALSEAEVKDLILAAIKETGAAGPKDMGKVMKLVQAQTKGRADGKAVSEQVKALLSANAS